MSQNPPERDSALLVHVDLPELDSREDFSEFQALVDSAGVHILDALILTRQTPDPKFFIGSGKVQEIQQVVVEHRPSVIIFNQKLSPSQERNLEKVLCCRVLDRIGLILDIFAQRARSFEGKLQVELAQLTHLSTRLIRGWTHLERQKGGIGLRGPGETQLETDRRLLRDRIKFIQKRLKKVRAQRNQSRQSRKRSAFVSISLVGYTNTGKTTLFKQLTGDSVQGQNKMFATLDTTVRKLPLSGTSPALLIDTVGFIRHLPHELIEAFQATLEETRDADLLLHVIDISNPNWRDQADQVNHVLAKIEADSVPQLIVYNKIDLVQDLSFQLNRDLDGKPAEIWLSGISGEGITLLRHAIAEALFGDPLFRNVVLKPDQGKLRAALYDLGTVLEEKTDDVGHSVLSIRIARKDYERLFNHTSES